MSYWSGYQGASDSTDRGSIFWPTTDTRLELDSFSRAELLRRIHWLKAHFGFVRGLIRNSADLVGWSTPQAQSGDDEWDDEAEERFRDVTGEAGAFDVAGKFDFDTAQPMLMRAAFTDSQVFTVMTKWEGTGAARFAFYEASQLRNPKDAGKDWVDGIRISRSRRHLAYGFHDSATDTVVVVPAAMVIYFGEFDSPGQDMPVPPLAHAVNHSIDITEVWGFLKKSIKTSSLSGAVIERDANAQPPRGRQGMPGAATTVTNAAGEKFQQANVWDGGQIASLEPGAKMKILADARPPAEQRQFTLDLIRDISTGFGLPPEVVWEMGRMTGPGIRFVMDFAGNWIRCRQKRQKVWAKKVWRYVIACEIAAGRLGLPQAPAAKPSSRKPPAPKWWAVSFTSQRLLTIDRGKESRARLDELDAGVGTLSDWEEFDGRDWKERGKQRIREVSYLDAECREAGLAYEKVFPPRQGAAKADASAPAPTPAEESDTEIDTEEEDE